LWGVSFGDDMTKGSVYINETPATQYTSWTDARIEFKVPEGAQSGSIRVQVGEETSNDIPFTHNPAGRLYYVDPDNTGSDDSGPGSAVQPWRTLTRAAQGRVPGDIVYIAESETQPYNETFMPLDAGTEELPIVFKALPGHRPLLDGTGLAGTPDGIRLDGDAVPGIGHLTFSGLRLRHFDQTIQMVQGAHHCRFFEIEASHGEGGLYMYGADNAFVAQSDFHHNKLFGVVFNNYASDILIRDSRSHDNAAPDGGGFEADFTVANITLFRCWAYNNKGDGFDLRVENLVLGECAAYFNRNGFHLWKNTVASNCWAYENQFKGFICDRLGEETPAQELINCTVAGGHKDAGIDVTKGVRIKIGNTISAGGKGPAVSFGDAYTSGTAIDRSILQTAGSPQTPTLVWGEETPEPLTFGDDAINQGAFAEQTGQTAVLLAGEPPDALFVNAEAGNLAPSSDSAARDFGTDLDAPEHDFTRRMRGVENALFDAGAYEYDESRSAVHAPAWLGYE
jgi:hypothetical protein